MLLDGPKATARCKSSPAADRARALFMATGKVPVYVVSPHDTPGTADQADRGSAGTDRGGRLPAQGAGG
jgi:hypothetical protein